MCELWKFGYLQDSQTELGSGAGAIGGWRADKCAMVAPSIDTVE